MLAGVLGLGTGLTWALGVLASLAMVLYVYQLLSPLVHGWFGDDPGLASMRMQIEPGEAGLDQRLDDALAPPPDVVSIDDLERPELCIPGVEALQRPSGPSG